MTVNHGFNRDVGLAVKHWRNVRGMTQQDLAVIMMVSRPSIANIELGRQSISFDQAVSLSEAFGISVIGLLRYRDRDIIRL